MIDDVCGLLGVGNHRRILGIIPVLHLCIHFHSGRLSSTYALIYPIRGSTLNTVSISNLTYFFSSLSNPPVYQTVSWVIISIGVYLRQDLMMILNLNGGGKRGDYYWITVSVSIFRVSSLVL